MMKTYIETIGPIFDVLTYYGKEDGASVDIHCRLFGLKAGPLKGG